MMAGFGQEGDQLTLIPKISQEALADMIGTTRSRVSFFMNRFRKLGFIDYKDRIRVHKSLLNVILQDQPSKENSQKASLLDRHRDQSEAAKHSTAKAVRLMTT